MKDVVLFDLDGTLTDPKEGITLSVQYALRTGGIDVDDPDSLCSFIGPPLKEQFMTYAGWDDAAATAAVERYRERFGAVGWRENRVYDGIPELLADLRASGRRLGVATSKPTVFAERILQHFGLRSYFECVCGSELDGRRTQKADVVAETLRRMQAVDTARVWMVGDRRHDAIGAAACHVDCVGVRYGYAAPGELESAGVFHIADTVADLREWLLTH